MSAYFFRIASFLQVSPPKLFYAFLISSVLTKYTVRFSFFQMIALKHLTESRSPVTLCKAVKNVVA